MVSIGDTVTVHTFAWSGRKGMVESIILDAPTHYANVRTVPMVTVRMFGRQTWQGVEPDAIACVPLTCVKGA